MFNPSREHPAASLPVLDVNVWNPVAHVPAVHPAAPAAEQAVHDASESASNGLAMSHAAYGTW